jgi:hypothetical protein
LWREPIKQSTIDQSKPFSFDLFLTSLWSVLQTRRSGMGYLPIVLVTLLMCIGVAWEFFIPLFLATTDPARYQCYALAFWFGTSATHVLPSPQCAFLNSVNQKSAFHLLPFEYPPLTVLVFSLPLLIPLLNYQVAFALLMAAVTIAIYWLLQSYGPSGSPVIFALYLLIGVPALALVRFDLLPALLTLLCMIAAERQRWTMAYCLLAFGVLLKIYPILLFPALFIAEQQALGRLHIPADDLSWRDVPKQCWYTLQGALHWRWRNCLLFVILLLVTTGMFASLDFHGAVVSQLSYFLNRPVQVESTGSTVLWIAQHMGIPWQRIEYSYGSINIVSDQLGQSVSLVGTSCLLVGVAYILWLQWRKKLDIVQASIALILVFLATGKTFSPQYLMWLIPLLAYSGAFNRLWFFCWEIISLLTAILYIFFYSQLPTSINAHIIILPVGFLAVVNARNTLFVIVTLAYLFNWWQIRLRRWLPLAQIRSREATTDGVAQEYPPEPVIRREVEPAHPGPS